MSKILYTYSVLRKHDHIDAVNLRTAAANVVSFIIR